jgi:CDP-diacylglycerol--glycerol-3-phosphate 3-phosphatidyltransferase
MPENFSSPEQRPEPTPDDAVNPEPTAHAPAGDHQLIAELHHVHRNSGVTRVISIPNILSLSRLLMLPPILLLLQARQGTAALVLMIISWVTDGLDGYLARRLHQVTNLGKVLDHLVDKIWVGTILVMLAATRGLPFWIAGAVIGRDLLIVVGSLLILDQRRFVVSSNAIGRITGCAFALLMLLYVVDNGYHWMRWPKLVALWVVGALIAVSFLNYLWVYVRRMRNTGKT